MRSSIEYKGSVMDNDLTKLPSKRIDYLDGLRGLAIMMVATYHAFARWPDLLPYGARFANGPAKFGLLGVQLFFLISGFVILMTLKRCRTYGEFLAKRWLRLFPAMLIATLLIFLTAKLLPLRPAGSPHLVDVLPGLSLIDDRWWEALLGKDVGPLEGAFWSIFTEVRFYLVFGILYFWRGEQLAIFALVGITALALIAARIGPSFESPFSLLDAKSFAWFAAGALFYRWHLEGQRRYLIYGLTVGLFAAYAYSYIWLFRGAAFAVLLVFPASLGMPRLQRLLSFWPMLFMGAISYPFYLIHENAMIAITRAMGAWGPDLLLPLPGFFVVVLAGWVIARQGEPRLRAAIENLIGLRKAAVYDTHGQPPLP